MFNKKIMRHNMKRIQSQLYRIGIYDVVRFLCFCFDDKRYMSGDGINNFPYFHKDIRS